MYELSKIFVFDAAHTLHVTVEPEASRRIHGHSYWVEVTVRGLPNPATGMVLELGIFEQKLNDVRASLDHHFLDEIDGLGPTTIENISKWIWDRLAPEFASGSSSLYKISIRRKSCGDCCTYYGPQK